jgi:NADH:ubiquinone oxidoreductase subunit 3 (subunit A)
MEQSQIAQYIPVLMLLVVAVGFAVSVLALSVLLGKFGMKYLKVMIEGMRFSVFK